MEFFVKTCGLGTKPISLTSLVTKKWPILPRMGQKWQICDPKWLSWVNSEPKMTIFYKNCDFWAKITCIYQQMECFVKTCDLGTKPISLAIFLTKKLPVLHRMGQKWKICDAKRLFWVNSEPKIQCQNLTKMGIFQKNLDSGIFPFYKFLWIFLFIF